METIETQPIRYAQCASPEYWLYPHEMADYLSQDIPGQLSRLPTVLCVTLGSREFIISRRTLDTGPIYFMAPYQR